MSRVYDNWGRLVSAVVRQEELRELCLASSLSSGSSDLSSLSAHSASSSSYLQSIAANHSQNDNVDNSHALRPENFYVNNKPLDSRELVLLLSCWNPPLNLRPGRYWYDKYAGFWGTEGNKPSQIITANLDVGGCLDAYVSNTNTLVHINGREITKVELRVLKMVGIKCPRHTHILMNEDGSYEEEANMPTRGSIWRKPGMKMLSSVFSLPFPPKPSRASQNLSLLSYVEQGDLYKFLLIGCRGSRATTIYNQAKFLYKDIPFLDVELNNITLLIRSNLCGYISVLLEAYTQFEVDSLNECRRIQATDEQGDTGYSDANAENATHSISFRLKEYSNWILQASEKLDFSSASFIQQYTSLLVELWKDPGFHETWKQASELETLPTSANYYLQRAAEIFDSNYEPTLMDILHLEDFPSSLSGMGFSFTLSYDDHIENEDKLTRYQLITVPTEWFEENYAWLEMFKHVRTLIFTISLANYDKLVTDGNGIDDNKMMVDGKFFESIVTHPSFDQTCLLLVLTEYELFEEKLKHTPLNRCDWFHEFNPVTDSDGEVIGNLGEMAFHYVSVCFKRIYVAATGRRLYVTKVNVLDQESVDAALKYAREILKWYEVMNDENFEEES